jgi:hypothetical protein
MEIDPIEEMTDITTEEAIVMTETERKEDEAGVAIEEIVIATVNVIECIEEKENLSLELEKMSCL